MKTIPDLKGPLRRPARGTDVRDDLIRFDIDAALSPGQASLYRLLLTMAEMRRPMSVDAVVGLSRSNRIHLTGLVQRGLVSLTPAGGIVVEGRG